MNALLQRRLTTRELDDLIARAPRAVSVVGEELRASVADRLRAVPPTAHRRLDAWLVEQAGRPSGPFIWSPHTARRVLGNNALRRVRSDPHHIADAVRDEIADQLLRCVTGYARGGSLAHWLAGLTPPVLGLTAVEATNWATAALECVGGLDAHWRVAASDVYYDVAGARTTLRGRRDVVIGEEDDRVVLRIRSGSPGKSAGSGLRSDLAAEALAHPQGIAPRRYLGLWPDAGLILGVEGSLENARAGARDFVRAAVAQRRYTLVRAA